MSKRLWIVLAAVSLVASPLAAGSAKVGKNHGQVKGRWLTIENVDAFKGYKAVALGEVSSDIQYKKADKDSPIDEQLLDEKIREQVLMRLRESGLFETVLESPPEDGEGVIRLDVELVVDPGSRAARYVVGFGAGKSQSIIEIFMRDHKTGEELGKYHGYGSGSGMGFKLAGGGARKMTQDDIQENAKRFVELLQEAL